MPTAPHAGSLRPRWPPDLHRRPPAAPAAIVPARNRPRERASRRHHASRPPATTMSPPAAVPTNSNTPPITQNTRPVRLLINHGLTPYLMLFTGDTLAQPVRRRRSLAVEPTTCAPDAFRSGDGLWTLAPGESSRVRGHSRRLTAGAATAAHSSHHDRNSVVLSSSRPGISSPSAGFRARENAIKTRRIPRWRDPDSNRGHRVSVGRTSRSNWAKSPVIRRVSVGSPGKAEASFLRTLSLRWVPRSVFRYPIEADGCDLAR